MVLYRYFLNKYKGIFKIALALIITLSGYMMKINLLIHSKKKKTQDEA